MVRGNRVRDSIADQPVVEEDVGDLCRRDNYCLYQFRYVGKPVGLDDDKVVTSFGTLEWSQVIHGHKLERASR